MEHIAGVNNSYKARIISDKQMLKDVLDQN